MTPGERFRNWIDGLAEAWKDRLRGWMASWITRGIDELIESMEPEGIELVRSNMAKVLDHPATPQDLKDLIGQLTAGKKPLPLLVLIPLAVLLFIPTLTSIFQPLGNLIRYTQERIFHSYRIDPMAVITAWRRDPVKYAGLFDDLKDQGWSEDRIDALKFFTQFMPSPQDLVNWEAKEVFEPEMITRYGLDDEFAGLDLTLFEKLGVTPEQALNYWRAHWEHASWMQVVEMLHRGLLTEEQVYDWFRLVEIPPFWRDMLIKTAYTWPTRVDVRRWWDMRTIDETELRRLYSGMGYRGVNLDNYILWTKVYTDFPSLMARWSKGWITEDDVRRELAALGMPAERVETMIQEKIKPEEAARVDEGKTLTKTEIYKGVKQGFITREQGIELIMDLGYNRAESEYLMDINVAVLEGSPETFAEFKDLTTKYKIATGREAKPMPEELKKAAEEVVRLTGEVKSLQRSITEEKRGLIAEEVLPAAATKRLKGLQVKLHRAEAELARVKTDYDVKVAEWRHGLP